MFSMENRREPRFASDQTVSITILGDPEIQRTGKVRNASGRGLGVEMAFPVGIGSALKIELTDGVVLGEAMYCRGQNGSYFVGIALEQALFGLSELSQAFQAFVEDASCRERGYAVERGRQE